MARPKRTEMLVAAALIVVLAVGAAVAYTRHASRQADAALQRAGTSLQKDVQRFHHDHSEYPHGVHLTSTVVQLEGTTATRTNTVDLGSAVRLAWYRDKPDPRLSTSSQAQASGYTFCLNSEGRHWRLNAMEAGVLTGGSAEGDCPVAPAP